MTLEHSDMKEADFWSEVISRVRADQMMFGLCGNKKNEITNKWWSMHQKEKIVSEYLLWLEK